MVTFTVTFCYYCIVKSILCCSQHGIFDFNYAKGV